MGRTALACVIIAFLVSLGLASPARAQETAVPGTCDEGQFSTGALWKICVPAAGWNHQLLVFAHGYVPNIPGVELGFYDVLPDGTELSTLVQRVGFAYATTSYRQNGLAILEGLDDIRDLVELFRERAGQPTRTYATGGSEGGLVTALLAERSPDLFTGALAACGPIGSFRFQINYFVDFRVLFDYFFPGVFTGSPIDISVQEIRDWINGSLPARIRRRLLRDREHAIELMRTSRAPHDPADFETVVSTALSILEYNVLATNDARAKLGGNPFGNRSRWYSGSSDDLQLNVAVRRFAANPAAIEALHQYDTSGDLRIPLIALHTTGDETVPFTHEGLYSLKERPSGRGRFVLLPIRRYGHCNFTVPEILAAFGVLLAQQ
ncbi:MAG: prolyl oligopeptidase family serine peptidase [Luteitalea sp.]|nr:prolyl oligopeptidase family serine peptidase [Luteitalea sp.]